MRNLLLILLLIVGFNINAQLIPIANTAHLASSLSWVDVSYDDFQSRTQYVSLDGQGMWEVASGLVTAQLSPDRVAMGGTGSTWNIAVYDTTYADDQGCEILSGPRGTLGPGVRYSATENTGYSGYTNSTETKIVRYNAGVKTDLATGGDTFTEDDEVNLIIIGYVMTLYINGLEELTYDDSGSADKIASGSPAILLYGSSGTYSIQTFTGREYK